MAREWERRGWRKGGRRTVRRRAMLATIRDWRRQRGLVLDDEHVMALAYRLDRTLDAFEAQWAAGRGGAEAGTDARAPMEYALS